MADDDRNFGQKAADYIARWGGSWRFLFAFNAFLVVWIVYNTITNHPFDVYPFILLNFVLSYLASMQAPIIMMSQRRADEINAKRDQRDLEVDEDADRILRKMAVEHGELRREHRALAVMVAELHSQWAQK